MNKSVSNPGETVAYNIAYFRKRQNLTQAELGEMCYLSKSEISRYETSAVIPDAVQVKLIADALDINISMLYSEDISALAGASDPEYAVIQRSVSEKVDFIANRIIHLESDYARLDEMICQSFERLMEYFKSNYS